MGTATVGRIGSESRLDYTAIGNVVNLASRLCSVAQDRQILTETVAAGAVSPHIRVRSLGGRALRGYLDPIEIFSVEAHKAAQAGAGASASE
jgi:class 3 adenylate cyclase